MKRAEAKKAGSPQTFISGAQITALVDEISKQLNHNDTLDIFTKSFKILNLKSKICSSSKNRKQS